VVGATITVSATDASAAETGLNNKWVYMYVDNVNYSGYQKIYAVDDFSSTPNGGTGWGGSWNLTGNASIATGLLQLTSNSGVAERVVNLSGVTDANLSFNWKADSFESGETAVVEIYNGTSWITVMTISDGQDDNIYHHASINLAGYTLGSSFKVRFRSLMVNANDFLYVGDLKICL
jgi:hypothetical protein